MPVHMHDVIQDIRVNITRHLSHIVLALYYNYYTQTVMHAVTFFRV